MKVNPENVYERIAENWSSITFRPFEPTDGIMKFEATATLRGVDDDILISTIVGDQVLAIDFVFDYLNADDESYQMINTFNQRNLFYKGFIREDGFFVVNYHAPVVTEEQAAQEFTYAMLGLAEENLMNTLVPITRKTFQEKKD